MTKVVFETATIADVLNKAMRCNPNDGVANTDIAGTYLMIRPGERVVVRATNLETFYTEWVETVNIEGPAVDWRVSNQAARFIGNMPIGAGRTVIIDDETGVIQMRDGKNSAMRGTVPRLTTTNYPRWEPFSEAESSAVPALASKLEQVIWAAAKPSDKGDADLQGIYFDGDQIMATNRYRVASVPCEVPIIAGRQPVTVPAAILSRMVHHSGDVRVSITPKGLGISPDDHSQIEVLAYARNFCEAAMKAAPRTFDHTLNVNCEEMVNIATRMQAIVKTAKNPLLKLFIGGRSILFHAKGDSDQEVTEDAVPAEGADHAPTILSFDPQIFIDAMGKCPSPRADLSYNLTQTRGKANVAYLSGGAGYESWFMQKVWDM